MAADGDHADPNPGVLSPGVLQDFIDLGAEHGTHGQTDLGLPYKPHTRQVQGRRTEKMIAKDIGARLHPNSGSGRIKEDASDEYALYEIKDAGKTHTLSSKSLETSFVRATRQGKESVWIIKFGNGITATMRLTKEDR